MTLAPSISQEIRSSGLFDRDWYRSRYRDVEISQIPPLEHFVRIGMKIGRDPGPGFDTAHYLKIAPEAADSGMAPIMHYIRVGRERGLTPRPGALTPEREPAAARSTGAEAPAAPGPREETAARATAASGPVFRPATDAFSLRGLEPMADLAVVIDATDPDLWPAAQGGLADLLEPCDLFVLGTDRLDVRLESHADTVRSVSLCGPGDAPGDALAFWRLAISGTLAPYRAVLWLGSNGTRPEAATIESLIAAGPGFAAEADRGLASDRLDRIDETMPERLRRALKIALPRLGLGFPGTSVACPSGTGVWLRPMLLRALEPALRPGELLPGNDKAFPGRATVLCLLAAMAERAALGIGEAATVPAPVPVTASVPAAAAPREVRTVAFYLPQFHPIAENDRWWGKGFTEWANVVRGRQLFRGHYQPRVPADLGFYDLRLEETQIAQAELARAFGVHGFCFYYYWFAGKKLLNRPIEQFAASGRIDAGFCACWANENWSRNWDGQNRHVLMEQTYDLDSNVDLIRELIPMMKDPRWIRHEGRPVMMVYRISIIPNWQETAAAWRAECRKAGLGEIHLCAVRFGLETLKGSPADHGLDAYVMFPPHEAARVDLRDKVLDLHKDFNGQIFDYEAVVDGDLAAFEGGYDWPVHRGAMLGWDNTARRLTDARIFHGATPYGFRRWMKGILQQEARHRPDADSLVFVNAWNEWAEGTYLEPDRRWGKAWLKAIASATASVPGTRAAAVPRADRTKAVAARPAPADTPQDPLAALGSPMAKDGAALAPPTWHEGAREADPDRPTLLVAAHVSGHHLFGGERSLLDVLEALAEMPVNVVVTLPSDNNRAYVDAVTKLTLGAYAFPYPQWRDGRDDYAWVELAFADILVRHAVDLVHVNTIVVPEPLSAATRLGRGRVIHVREIISLDEPLRQRIGAPLSDIMARVFASTDWLIGNSDATCRLFSRGERIFYVPNAIRAESLDMGNRFGKGIKFGIVSSNIPVKGVQDFVEVAARAAERAPRAQFVVIGPENDRTRAWAAEVAEGRRPGNLQFLGYRKDPRAAMSELNVLLNLSSFAESFGRTVAEAMAASRPVIAYDWGALPELVEDGETGFLVPYRDIDAVVERVVALCDDDARIGAMGEAGKAKVTAEFSHERLTGALRDAYAAMLGRPMDDAAVPEEAPAPLARTRGLPPRTTVVIPVYNAPDEVRECLDSVLRWTDLTRDRVIVIDDASPDPVIAPLLSSHEGTPGLTIERNAQNLGYTRTVNRGLELAGEDDVVLLNSDTIVTPKWLEGLRTTAYKGLRTGTVTAMSDNAGAFSFPTFNARCPKPDDLSHEAYALKVVQAAKNCAAPRVPTGSGFCLYIRRALIDAIGGFDAEGFPRGYGEENDFCMRAQDAGWSNLVSPLAFVFHERSASFKEAKTALVKAGVDEVTKRYPAYARLTKAAFSAPEMEALRAAVAGVRSGTTVDGAA